MTDELDPRSDEPYQRAPVLTEAGILELNRRDMEAALFDDSAVPMPPDGTEEPQSVADGTEPVDMVSDHTPVDEDILDVELSLGLTDGTLEPGLEPVLEDQP